MTMHSFYAFYPSDYDPRHDPTYNDDSLWAIRQRLAQIPPKSPIEHAAFDTLAQALYNWAIEEDKRAKGRDESVTYILKLDKDFYANHDSKFFLVTEIPTYHRETWYLHMINVANDNGIIVYSTLDTCFYFPDGTSYPSTAREWLEAFVREQNQAFILVPQEIRDIMAQEQTYSANALSPYLDKSEKLNQAIGLMVEEFLTSLGISDFTISNRSDGYCAAYFAWSGMKVHLNIKNSINRWDEGFDHPFIELHPVFEVFSVEPYQGQKPFEIIDMLARLKFQEFEYQRGLLQSTLPKDQHWQSSTYEEAIERMRRQRRIYSMTQLYQAIHQFLAIIKYNILAYHSLYELFDSIYTGRNKILYSYFWQLPIDNISSSRVEKMIYVARFIHYPELEAVIEKVLKRLAENDIILQDVEKERLETIMVGYHPK